MRRRNWAMVIIICLLALLSAGAANAQSLGFGMGVPDTATVYPAGGATSPILDFTFTTGLYYQNGVSACVSAATCLTVTRTTTNGSATNLLPTSASGQAITTYGDNVGRFASNGALIVEEARVNQLLNATTPITQTTASINCASPGCTIWVNGSGSATPSAGSATGCSGLAAATQGSSDTFICTGAGTIVVTVSGSLNAFQLEAGSFGTSLCNSGASACSRGIDTVTLTTVPALPGPFSIYASGTPEAPASFAANQWLFGIDAGANANRFALFRANSTGVPAAVWTVAGVGASGGPASPTSGFYKIAASGIAGAQAISANGGAVTNTTVTGTPAGLNTVHIGVQAAGNLPWNGTISRVALWPATQLSASQLSAITSGTGP